MNWSKNIIMKIIGLFLSLAFFVPYMFSLSRTYRSGTTSLSTASSPLQFPGSMMVSGRFFSTAELFFLAFAVYCLVAIIRWRSLDQVARSLVFLVAAEMALVAGQTRWFSHIIPS